MTAFSLSLSPDNIARLVFDLPGERANVLSQAVLEELRIVAADLAARGGVRGLLLVSAKKDIFVAGADLKEIQALADPGPAAAYAREGQRILQALADLKFPTLAVVDGAALGGGLELALACSHRVVSDHPKAILGLPETTLGLLPGFGGSQRLPRLVGLEASLSMILSGKPVGGAEAARIGLADACFPRAELWDSARRFLLGAIEGRRPPRDPPPEPADPEAALAAAEAAHVRKVRGRNAGPETALELLRRTRGAPLAEGLAAEAEAFGRVAAGPCARALVGLFFVRDRIRKDPQAPAGAEPLPVRRAAVLGAGVMGSSIAWLLSNGEIPVILKDVAPDLVERGLARAAQNYADLARLGKMAPAEGERRMKLLTGATDYAARPPGFPEGFRDADLVVEAVVEELALKRRVFAEVEPLLRDEAILASNTSTLSITEMAKGLRRPERFIGIHFFNPVNRMELVEVIPGAATAEAAVATAVALAKRLGKTPVVTASCTGFLANRVLFPYLNEALLLAEEGADLEEADRALVDFGMPMGPFTLMDEIGLDVCLKIAPILEEAYGERMRTPEILKIIAGERGLLGRKGGRGFYLHEGKARRLNPEAAPSIAQARGRSGIAARAPGGDELLDRPLLAMLNECVRCLREKVVARADYLDLALLLGFGFPAWRGGLLRHADERGIPAVAARLAELSRLHGPRFEPDSMLAEMAVGGKKFY